VCKLQFQEHVESHCTVFKKIDKMLENSMWKLQSSGVHRDAGYRDSRLALGINDPTLKKDGQETPSGPTSA